MSQGQASSGLRWVMYPQTNQRFPFQLFVEHEPGRFLTFAVQDKWPGPGKSIFCLAGPELGEDDLPVQPEPADSCLIKYVSRFGRKLMILLDRKNRKRSWFLTIERRSKVHPDKTYQQTFWITQASAAAKRGGTYLSGLNQKDRLTIVRDTRERYGYNFSGHELQKAALASGDYALKLSTGETIAAVERKTKDGFLHTLATLDVLKAQLAELCDAHKYCALVIEADYRDLVNPKKARFYSARLVAEAIADLQVSFPRLQVVFCSNRKYAAEWVSRFFQRISRREEPKQQPELEFPS